jgi:hypothetical protein
MARNFILERAQFQIGTPLDTQHRSVGAQDAMILRAWGAAVLRPYNIYAD